MGYPAYFLFLLHLFLAPFLLLGCPLPKESVKPFPRKESHKEAKLPLEQERLVLCEGIHFAEPNFFDRQKAIESSKATTSRPISRATLHGKVSVQSAAISSHRKGFLPFKHLKSRIQPICSVMNRCVERLRKLYAKPKRLVQVHFLVGPDGKVWKSQWKGGLSLQPPVQKCLKRLFHRILFAKPQGGGFFPTHLQIQL